MKSTLDKEKNSAQNARPEKITSLAYELKKSMQSSLGEINNINTKTKLLSFNAQIQAAKAGAAGTSFAVVASEMNNLSAMTGDVSQKLVDETQGLLSELEEISHSLGFNVRGKRLSDIALTNIDLIDRNLYERTCDVRWWATDSALVDALNDQTSDAYDYASRRMGVILSAYTVYYDLVLCDLNGRVVANGKPDQYSSKNMTVEEEEWFQKSLRSRCGDEYGFQAVHKSSLVNNEHVLTYACGVREGGEANGKLIGVLGILFNWESLAQTIVKECPIPMSINPEDSRVLIVDSQGTVLADSRDQILSDTLTKEQWGEIFSAKTGFHRKSLGGSNYIVGHARAPGFEGYSTNWFSVIIQKTDN